MINVKSHDLLHNVGMTIVKRMLRMHRFRRCRHLFPNSHTCHILQPKRLQHFRSKKTPTLFHRHVHNLAIALELRRNVLHAAPIPCVGIRYVEHGYTICWLWVDMDILTMLTMLDMNKRYVVYVEHGYTIWSTLIYEMLNMECYECRKLTIWETMCWTWIYKKTRLYLYKQI